MKLKHVMGLGIVGMALSSASVWALSGPEAAGSAASGWSALAPDGVAGAVFQSSGTLIAEARLGHAELQRGSRASTFVYVEVTGSDRIPTERPPLHMALVIDRSGSMQGERLASAVRAASGVIDHLADGDRVTVVSFDQESELVVPSTTLGPRERQRVREALGRIELGGSTCISCGIEDALRQLESHAGDSLQRVLVLSDGAANHGIRDVDGFRSLAAMCRRKGIAISTVGVGLDYNERILSSLAFESNGRHHFVESDLSLPAVFQAETRDSATLVASSASVSVDLAAGVRLLRVLDRSFSQTGRRIDIPLGTFAPGETKTILLEVELPVGSSGPQAVAGVALSFRDWVNPGDRQVRGHLAVTPAALASPLDPVVLARVERSRTSAALEEANELAKQGDFAAANDKLKARLGELKANASKAKALASGRGQRLSKKVDEDFERQLEAADKAAKGFDPEDAAPASAAPRKRTVLDNAAEANRLEL